MDIYYFMFGFLTLIAVIGIILALTTKIFDVKKEENTPASA